MRHFVLLLSLATLLGCSDSPEVQLEQQARIAQERDNIFAQLAKGETAEQCYVAVNLDRIGDGSVATRAVDIANAVKETWMLISYGQEFNVRGTAIFKRKSC